MAPAPVSRSWRRGRKRTPAWLLPFHSTSSMDNVMNSRGFTRLRSFLPPRLPPRARSVALTRLQLDDLHPFDVAHRVTQLRRRPLEYGEGSEVHGDHDRHPEQLARPCGLDRSHR